MIPSTFADYHKFAISLHWIAEGLQKSEKYYEIIETAKLTYSSKLFFSDAPMHFSKSKGGSEEKLTNMSYLQNKINLKNLFKTCEPQSFTKFLIFLKVFSHSMKTYYSKLNNP